MWLLPLGNGLWVENKPAAVLCLSRQDVCDDQCATRRDLAVGGVQAAVIEPVDVLEGGDLDLLDGPPQSPRLDELEWGWKAI